MLNVPKPFENSLAEFDAVARQLGIEYALIGGIAVILRGYDRSTRDIDLTAWDLDRNIELLVNALTKRGFKPRTTDWLAFSKLNRVLLLSSADGVDFDISLGGLEFERDLIDRAEALNISADLNVNVAQPSDLIVMKIFAGRPRDIEDVRRLAELFPEINVAQMRTQIQSFSELLDQPEMVDRFNQIFGA